MITKSVAAAIAAVCSEHSEVLSIAPYDITTERAHKAVGSVCQTTTEMLLLLAALHGDTDLADVKGAEMLARFAAEFAAHEATVV